MKKALGFEEEIKHILKQYMPFRDFRITTNEGFTVLALARPKRNLFDALAAIKHPKPLIIETIQPGNSLDETLLKRIIRALQRNTKLATDNLIIYVEETQVILEGLTTWRFENEAIGRIIWGVKGVQSVCNLMKAKYD
jgi:hypothetical protein